MYISIILYILYVCIFDFLSSESKTKNKAKEKKLGRAVT